VGVEEIMAISKLQVCIPRPNFGLESPSCAKYVSK